MGVGRPRPPKKDYYESIEELLKKERRADMMDSIKNKIGLYLSIAILLSFVVVVSYYKHQSDKWQLRYAELNIEHVQVQASLEDATTKIKAQNDAITALQTKQKDAEKLSAQAIEEAKKNAVVSRRKARQIGETRMSTKDACTSAQSLFEGVIHGN